MVNLKLVLIIITVLVACAIFIISTRKRKTVAIDISDDSSEMDEFLCDDSYDLYGEIKAFMAKQTQYVMNGE
jgi:hypothetical protein